MGARAQETKLSGKSFNGKRKELLFHQCMAKSGAHWHRMQVSDMIIDKFKGFGKVKSKKRC